MNATTVPALPDVNLAVAVKRAAFAYAVMSGAVTDVNIPLRTALHLGWENGAARVEIGDARTARAVASRLGLTPAGSPSALTHTWSGIYADLPVTVIGRGVLAASDGDGARRDTVAASRRRGLLFPVGAGMDVTA